MSLISWIVSILLLIVLVLGVIMAPEPSWELTKDLASVGKDVVMSVSSRLPSITSHVGEIVSEVVNKMEKKNETG